MANNKIEIFQSNSQTVGCYITSTLDLSTYTPYLTVKKKTTNTAVILTKTGTVTDASTTVTFDLTPTDTSMNPGDYVYDITIVDGTAIYTVVKDIFSIKDGVKY
jgi:hypothetical protein